MRCISYSVVVQVDDESIRKLMGITPGKFQEWLLSGDSSCLYMESLYPYDSSQDVSVTSTVPTLFTFHSLNKGILNSTIERLEKIEREG